MFLEAEVNSMKFPSLSQGCGCRDSRQSYQTFVSRHLLDLSYSFELQTDSKENQRKVDLPGCRCAGTAVASPLVLAGVSDEVIAKQLSRALSSTGERLRM